MLTIPAHAQTWTITTIDAGGDVGRYPDLQVDASGSLHVAYIRQDSHTLKALSRVAGSWGTPEVIDNSGVVGNSSSLAVDASGDRKAVYQRTDSGALCYAGPEGVRSWTSSAVVQQGDVGRALTLVPEPAGELGVAYRSQTTGALHHIRRAGGAWGSPAVVDPGPNRGQQFDLAYRPGEGYLFSEYAPDFGGVLLADPTLRAREWNVQPATAQANDVGRDLRLLVPADGNLTAAFRNQTQGSLQMIRRVGGDWTTPVNVDPGPNRGQYFDIAERSGVGFALSERSPEDGALVLADPVLTARSWSTAAIASGSDDVGRELSLLETADGALAASYRNLTQGSLQHVRRESGVWTSPATVDPGPGRGQYHDLAHVPGGGYCFSEFNPTVGAALFAHPFLRGRTFAVERIDGVLNAGQQLSLLPRSSGRLDCAYVTQEAGGRLKLKVAEIVPQYAFIVRTVADSVSMTANGQVRPDLFVTGEQNWRVSYQKVGPNDLYLASTDDFQLLPADVPEAPEEESPEEESLDPLARSILEGAYPNPTPAQFRVRYSSAAEAAGELTVYDAQGRLARRIEVRCKRGENTFPFDGMGDSGSPLAAGVYFVRMAVAGRELGTVKMVLLGDGLR
jgi:hypothetical protein